MVGNITKKYSFGTIIKVNDLLSLDKYVRSIYPYITYMMKTSDGADYKLDSIKDIIEYDNFDSRKIIVIYIYANKNDNKYISYSDLEISILDYNVYGKSVLFTIRNASQNEIEAYSNKIEELTGNFKSPYRCINTWTFYLTSVISSCIIVSILISKSLKNLTEEYEAILLINLLLGSVIAWIGYKLYRLVWLKLYPNTVFLIGKQIDVNNRRKQVRQIIGNVIIGGIIISVISSVIVNYILK